MRGIYFDNSAATKPSQRAITAMLPFYSEFWGSISSPHFGGHELMRAVEDSYKAIYHFLDASEDDTFILTSSGAEAVNQVFHSIYWGVSRRKGANHYIALATGEAPSLMCVSKLEEMGCRGTMIWPAEKARDTVQAIEHAISEETALVSLSWGDGLTGLIAPVAEIAELCHARGIALHLDATHVLGKINCHIGRISPDYLTFDGNALHAPRGSGGVLFHSTAVRHPLIVGGIEQLLLRAGTLDVAALVALAEACREAEEERDYLCTETARLRNKLEKGIASRCHGSSSLFEHQERLPHITVLSFPSIVNEALLFVLNNQRLFASIGGGAFQQLALVLQAYQIEPQIAHSAISFSLSRMTSEEEVDMAIEICTKAIQ